MKQPNENIKQKICKYIEANDRGDGIPYYDLLKKTQQKQKLESFLKIMIREGDLFEPTPGFIQKPTKIEHIGEVTISGIVDLDYKLKRIKQELNKDGKIEKGYVINEKRYFTDQEVTKLIEEGVLMENPAGFLSII